MKWFKHDSNAHTDDKIQKILMRYGSDGYALYWYCIELIAARVAPDNITFELKHDAEVLGFHLQIDTLRVEKIMIDMVNLGLFEHSGDTITCLKLAKRLDNTMTQNKELKETLSNFNSLAPEEKRIEEKRKDKKKPISPTAAPVFNFKKALLDLGVSEEVVTTWLAVRRNKKATNSELALKGILAEVQKAGISVAQAIEISATNSWSGFKAEWVARYDGNGGPASTKQTSINDDLTNKDWATGGEETPAENDNWSGHTLENIK